VNELVVDVIYFAIFNFV